MITPANKHEQVPASCGWLLATQSGHFQCQNLEAPPKHSGHPMIGKAFLAFLSFATSVAASDIKLTKEQIIELAKYLQAIAKIPDTH